MRLIIQDESEQVGEWAAKYVRKRINEFLQKNEEEVKNGKTFNLGLPTGRPTKNYHIKILQLQLLKLELVNPLTELLKNRLYDATKLTKGGNKKILFQVFVFEKFSLHKFSIESYIFFFKEINYL